MAITAQDNKTVVGPLFQHLNDILYAKERYHYVKRDELLNAVRRSRKKLFTYIEIPNTEHRILQAIFYDPFSEHKYTVRTFSTEESIKTYKNLPAFKACSVAKELRKLNDSKNVCE